MNKFTKNDIKTMFSELCCSKCKNDFSIDSIRILENFGKTFICELKCEKCGKDFGQIVLNYDKKSKIHPKMTVIDGPLPISQDDVIDAHNYIQKNL